MRMNLKLAMISQPMRGKTDEEIQATRNRAIEELKAHGYTVANTYFKDLHIPLGTEYPAVYSLARALKVMSTCTLVYFCDGWENTRGCKIEHEVACAYGLTRMYENPKNIPTEGN